MRRSRRLLAAALVALVLPPAAAAIDVLFSWPADPDPAVTGYAVYRRTGGADWEKIDELPLAALDDPGHPAVVVTGLSPGATYWLAAASLYGDGTEGGLFASTCLRVGDAVFACSDEEEDATRVYVSCFLATAGR